MWHMGTWLVKRAAGTRHAARRGRGHAPARFRRVASGGGPRGTWNPVTCLFSLIARCGRGSFQLSVLVSHGVSSRGARPDTPVPGPYKLTIQTGAGRNAQKPRGARLSRKRVPSLATAVHTLLFITLRDTFFEPLLPIHP